MATTGREPGTAPFGDPLPGGPDVAASEVEVASRSTDGAGRDGDSGHVVTHHAAVTIQRPAADVAAYVFDPTTMPHWSGILYEIEPIADIEPRRGRRMRANLKILGVCVTVEGELVEVDPRARWAVVRIVPVGGDGTIEHRLWVEEAPDGGDGSVLRFWNRVEVPAWLSSTVSDSLVRRFLDHTATFALANIKDVLEHGEEDKLRQLQLLARQRVPAPTPLQT